MLKYFVLIKINSIINNLLLFDSDKTLNIYKIKYIIFLGFMHN